AVTQAEGPAVAVPPPPQIDPVKAAADAEAEALKLAQLEFLKKMNVVRRWCVKISTHEDFEFVVFVLIFANIVTLAMYNPLKSDSSRYNFVLDRIQLGFNAFFTLELILRAVASGGPKAYLSNAWNIFDLLMVLAGYTEFLPASWFGNNTQSVKALRALRALRPLRTITRFDSLRAIVVCFLEALPLLSSAVLLLLIFIFLFGVAGIQLFQDAAHQTCCNNVDGSYPDPALTENSDEWGCGHRHCPSNYTCTTFSDVVLTDGIGFNNIAAAMVSVIQILTYAAWSYMMYRFTDTYGIYAIIYSVLCIIIGCYFVVNLFIAVLKIKFAKAQTLFHSKLAKMSKKKRKNILGRGLDMGMVRPEDGDEMAPLKQFIFDQRWLVRQLVEDNRFNQAFLGITILNTFFLALSYDGMSNALAETLTISNYIFTGLFTMEMILKLFALGFFEYVADSFNIFDGVVVVLSIVEIILDVLKVSSKGFAGIRVLRAFRVLRLFKVFKYIKSLRKITEVLLASAASFLAIASLILLFMIVFAIIGLHVYGGTQQSDEYPNFSTFLLSVTTMFQVLTLENYDNVQFQLADDTNFGALIFILAWVVFGYYVLLVLFMAIILEAFESKYDKGTIQDAYLA
ncbi:MAG: voltage-gated Ca2+ alpha subunit, partial [Trebouxia sp. A1-2]